MKTIETDIVVTRDGRAKIHLDLTPDVQPGRHRAVVVIDERPVPSAPRRSLEAFPVHDFGPWPEDLSLRRADLYGDDER